MPKKYFKKIEKIRSESIEQIMLMQWCKRNAKTIPQLDKIFAIPNGGLRNKSTAAKLKLEGVKKGVPDLFLAVPNKYFHGLFIEMKRIKGGVLSKEQKIWKELLTAEGYCWSVAKGFQEGKAIIEEYLKLS